MTARALFVLALALLPAGATAQTTVDPWRGLSVGVRDTAPPLFAARLQALGANFPGIVAISVRDIDAGWSAGYNDTRLCPQQSVSKLWVAITVFDAVDRGAISLSDPVTITRGDLTLFHQPVRALVSDGGYRTTVADLLERAMGSSDNTANDALLRHVGGTSAVRAMLARLRVGNIRFGPGERLLQSQIAGVTWNQSLSVGNAFDRARAAIPYETRARAFSAYIADPIDGAAPASITQALAMLERGHVLTPRSRDALFALMGRSKTGRARLKAGTGTGWTVAHKTGTGQNFGGAVAGFNDVGLLVAPDGHRYAVAVMIAQSSARVTERQKLIADVARLVGARWAETSVAMRGYGAVY